jgi:imidazolonepropionase-like amidohydrolase
MVNLAGEVGMIAARKLANLVIWDNDPLAIHGHAGPGRDFLDH